MYSHPWVSPSESLDRLLHCRYGTQLLWLWMMQPSPGFILISLLPSPDNWVSSGERDRWRLRPSISGSSTPGFGLELLPLPLSSVRWMSCIRLNGFHDDEVELRRGVMQLCHSGSIVSAMDWTESQNSSNSLTSSFRFSLHPWAPCRNDSSISSIRESVAFVCRSK